MPLCRGCRRTDFVDFVVYIADRGSLDGVIGDAGVINRLHFWMDSSINTIYCGGLIDLQSGGVADKWPRS